MIVVKVVCVIFFFIFIMTENCRADSVKSDFPEFFYFTIRRVANPRNIIKKFGYPAETHKVVTKDGYVLTLHRIPRGIKYVKRQPPVLIMHGLGSSSADFINMGPKTSLGYLLADEGYDVWIGNARGNSYSNRHVYLNPDLQPEKFYDFSWHEIGTIDLPAKIDYILKRTNQTELYYIGHSQGGTIFYVMASTKPEYNEKIRLASLMAPAGFVANVPERGINILSEYVDNIQSILDLFQIYHLPSVDLIRSILQSVCQFDKYFPLCKELFYIFGAGYNDENQLNKTAFPTIFQTTPSDASSKQFLHYFQEIKSGKFQHFDYGPDTNLKVYGSVKPLEYNLSAITAPVTLYYAKNDRFVGVKDVQKMATRLSRVVNDYLVPYDQFNHGDFLFANDVKPLIYEELLRIMDCY